MMSELKLPPPIPLFHYTTVENLALILESAKIRFTRLDQVNDLEETQVSDFPAIREATFVSCWTRSCKESIPLWALYASRAKGVRIKLPSDMFNKGFESKPILYGRSPLINLLSLENTFQSTSKVHQWIPYIFGPVLMEYKQSNSVCVLEDGELRVERIGTVKMEHWRFEEESRFLVIPDALWNPELNRFEANSEFIGVPTRQRFIDINLDKSRLDHIEITLGPAAKSADKYIVEALLSKYAANGKLLWSRLKNRISMGKGAVE